MSKKYIPEGKGLYVWTIKSLPDNWVELYKQWDIKWLAVKIADGVNSFNLRPLPDGSYKDDILLPWVNKAKQAGFRVLGWQYVYGFNPLDEADKASRRMKDLGLKDGFLIDAEGQYFRKFSQATQYCQTLRRLMPEMPIALSSYRFPETVDTANRQYRKYPFEEFLAICDYNAPQVYWNDGRAEEELISSFSQYANIKLLPFVPAGRAYYEGAFPPPTYDDTMRFLRTAQNMKMSGAFFWSADFLNHRFPDIYGKMNPSREAIEDYEWKSGEPEEPAEPSEPEPCPEQSHSVYQISGWDVEIKLLSETEKLDADE